jgi:hypothetical protein
MTMTTPTPESTMPTKRLINQSTALAPFEPTNVIEAIRLAETLAASGLVPKDLRNKPSDVLVVLMKGRELGMPPMASLANIAVFDGKTVVSADATQGLVLASGKCEYFTLIESTELKATYEAKRRDSVSVVRLSWTLEMAKAAGLLAKDNWRKYPVAMLRARASMDVAREVCPDVCAGLYTAEELDIAPVREVSAEVKPQRPSTIADVKRALNPAPAPREIDVTAKTTAHPEAVPSPDVHPADPTAPTADPVSGPSSTPSAPAARGRSPRDAGDTSRAMHAGNPESLSGAVGGDSTTAQDSAAPSDDEMIAPTSRDEAPQADAASEPQGGEALLPIEVDPMRPWNFERRLRFKQTPASWDTWKDSRPWRGMLADVTPEQAIQGSKGGKRHAGLAGVIEWAKSKNYSPENLPAAVIQADYCLAILEERWNI